MYRLWTLLVACSLVLAACQSSNASSRSANQPSSPSRASTPTPARSEKDQLTQVIREEILPGCTYRLQKDTPRLPCDTTTRWSGRLGDRLVTLYYIEAGCVYDVIFAGPIPESQNITDSRGPRPKEDGGKPIPEMCGGSALFFTATTP